MSQYRLVGDFHRKFGLPTGDIDPSPKMVDNETFLFRYQFLMEELMELVSSHRQMDIVGVADALVDLVYVALGTAHMYGIPFDRVFDEVQRSNMEKERSTGGGDGRSKRGSSLDVVKPEGWSPPDIRSIIEEYMK